MVGELSGVVTMLTISETLRERGMADAAGNVSNVAAFTRVSIGWFVVLRLSVTA